ncbi:unnamed protein product [Caenorhabditis auriculariae]|uniref:Prokaryotic-type class I peptide chain release factors domain-containing protein n=1 Tax=Caenorhabditis auriculariae TaxID=2777116 RepID=A0A8S1HZ14_9PELO|nr:unnamed protein product [Caenorhabditis auriculariae]
MLKRLSTRIFILRTFASPKEQLKGYQFPEVRKEDCEQKYISGWGPGGQKVNTAQNAVQLTHLPTGIVLKVHESRLLPKNIDIAFERMKFALDRHFNGENCYEKQLERLQRTKEDKAKRKREKARKAKEELKEDVEKSDNL